MRERITRLVEHKRFHLFISIVIATNILVMAIQAQLYANGADESVLSTLNDIDMCFLAIYIVELCLKFIAWRGSFFKDGWNIFDLLIVLVSLVPFFGLNASALRIFRILRVLRAFRMFSAIKRLRVLAEALLKSLPSIVYTLGMLLILYLVYAIIGVELYCHISDDFAGLPQAFMSLFQMTTLESWPDIAKPIMDASPYAWIYFTTFIILAAFIILNVIMGVIVSAIDDADKTDVEQEISRDEAQNRLIKEEIGSVRTQIDATNEQIAALQASVVALTQQLSQQNEPERNDQQQR